MLRRGGSNPLGPTNFYGCISKRQGDCGKRSGEIPNMGSNPIASTILRRTAIMVFERLAKPWGAIPSGSDSQVLRH